MWSRRDMLSMAGAAAIAPSIAPAFVHAAALRGVAIPAQSPVGLPDDLPNPPAFKSVDGVLSTELTLGYHETILPSGPATLRRYNGMSPAPSWLVQPGDRIEVAFKNNLPPRDYTGKSETSSGSGHHFIGHLNTTNLHFHGFHVDPRGRSDNVFLAIQPGASFDYLVEIPDFHPLGTFWYHPHHHGSVSIQVASGMAGMIAMQNPEAAAGRGVVERHLVIQSPIAGPDGTLEDSKYVMALEDERFFTINGHFHPRIHIHEGETQHWRILSANDSQFMPLELHEIDGVEFAMIGRDGNPLGRAEPVKQVLLAPGNRIDLLATGVRPGKYEFGRHAFNQGLVQMPATHLGTIVVLPGRREASEKPRTAVIPPVSRIQKTIGDAEIKRSRIFELGHVHNPGQLLDTEFTINGKPHQPGVFDIVAKRGDAEEWILINLTPFPHPMHIHVNPFQVVEINGQIQTDPEWLDTVIVPAAGVVKIRTRFEDFYGDFVMHCHILPHEDIGLMINVRILP